MCGGVSATCGYLWQCGAMWRCVDNVWQFVAVWCSEALCGSVLASKVRWCVGNICQFVAVCCSLIHKMVVF